MHPSPRPFLNALTGLRFIAAAHVVVYHFGQSATSTLPGWVQNLLAGGDASVSLFFVLSGFILIYTYSGNGSSRLTPREFWVARFARLYPIYLLSLILAAPFTIADLLRQYSTSTATIKALTSLLPVLTLTQAWAWQTATKWNFPAWSISAEVFFYIVFPFLLPRVAMLRGRVLMTGVGMLWGLSMAAPLAFLAFDPDHLATQPHLFDGPWMSTVAYLPLLHLPEFLIGMLVGSAFLRRSVPLARGPATVLSLGAVVIVVAVEGSMRIADPLLHNGLLGPVFGVLVYALASGRGPAAWLLSLPLVVLLGEASYSMYLLQSPVWSWMSVVMARLSLGAASQGPAPLLAYLVILVGLSWLSFAVIERPARRALRRLLAGDGKPQPAAVLVSSVPSEAAAP